MSNPLRELLGWLLLGAVFLLVMRGYVRRWRARKRAFWAPLAPVVNGTARGLRLTGSYEAHEVIAEMGPVSDVGPRSPNRSAWCFTTSLDPVAGRDRRQRRRTVLQSEGVDWTARYGYELPLVAEGRPGWHVTSSSEQLRQKLSGGAILDRVEQWDSYPEIGYSARFKLISVTDDDPDRMTPDRFRSRLDLLVSLARQTGLVVLTVGVAILAGACRRGASSNGSSDRGSTGPARAADPRSLSAAEFRYGVSPTRNKAVTYQPDVVLIEHGAEAIRAAGSNGLTWSIAADAPHASELVPGRIMFATSRAVGRVLAIRRVGNTLSVVLGPVALTDVIRDAKLRYDGPVDLGSMIAYTAPDYPGAWAEGPKLIQTSDAAPRGETTVALASLSSTGELTPVRTAWPRDGPPPTRWSKADRSRFRSMLTGDGQSQPQDSGHTGGQAQGQGPGQGPGAGGGQSSGPGGGQAAGDAPAPNVGPPPQVSIGDFEMTPFCCGGLGIKVVHNAENVKIIAFAVLRLQQPSLHFDLDIRGGKVYTAEVQLWGASGLTVQFEAGTAIGVSGNIRRTFFVPVDLSIPIFGLAVPFAINVRQTFLLETAFSAQNSTLKAIGDYTFQGHIYMGYHQGAWGAGAPTSLTSRYNLANTLGGTSVGVTGLVLGYGGRIIVGIGAFGFVTGPYLGYNTSVGVTRGSTLNAIVVPRCRSSVLDISMKVGIGYSIPQPVTSAINFLLRALNVKTIESEGGIGHTEPVVHKADVTPAGCPPP